MSGLGLRKNTRKKPKDSAESMKLSKIEFVPFVQPEKLSEIKSAVIFLYFLTKRRYGFEHIYSYGILAIANFLQVRVLCLRPTGR